MSTKTSGNKVRKTSPKVVRKGGKLNHAKFSPSWVVVNTKDAPSYQMELIDEYENYKQTIIVQEENSRTQFLKDRAKLENDISSLEGRKYY